jgi:hypothetical protein
VCVCVRVRVCVCVRVRVVCVLTTVLTRQQRVQSGAAAATGQVAEV